MRFFDKIIILKHSNEIIAASSVDSWSGMKFQTRGGTHCNKVARYSNCTSVISVKHIKKQSQEKEMKRNRFTF